MVKLYCVDFRLFPIGHYRNLIYVYISANAFFSDFTTPLFYVTKYKC